VDEEVEADEEFWNQDAFKEDDADNEYKEELEFDDEFDSDFDDEEEGSDGGEADEEERHPTRRRKLPPGRKPFKKAASSGTSKKGVSFVEEAAAAAAAGDTPVSLVKPARQIIHQQSPDDKENGETLAVDGDGERTVRKSTRTAVIVKQAEREALRVALQATPRPMKKKKGEEERKMSQEEMLLEAAQTEIQNRQSLEIMLAREEEVKRRAIIHKEIYNGPQIRYISRNGTNIMEFTKVPAVPEIIRAEAKPYPKRAVCVVTGLPARYRDPQTGLPYATKEAFKVIRDRLGKGGQSSQRDSLEKSHQRKRTKVEREKPGPGGRTSVATIKFKKTLKSNTQESTPLDLSHIESSLLEEETHKTLDSNSGSTPEGTIASLTSEPIAMMTQNTLPEDKVFRQFPEEEGMSAGPVRFLGPLPKPMVEANEADFILEDLEVSLPSNLESTLSLPMSTITSSIVQAGDLSGENGVRGLHLEHGILDLSSEDQGLPRFSEGYDMSLDVPSHSSLLSLDVSWLQNT